MKARQQPRARLHTLLEPYGPQPGHDCGYCGGTGGSLSFGMRAHFMAPAVYETLIYRGWRRSGTYMYQPDNERTCCPQWPIRTPVAALATERLSKKTRALLRKGRRLLAVEDRAADAEDVGGEVFALFRKYEAAVHGKEEREEGAFRRFLCDGPLAEAQRHLLYREVETGKLVAVCALLTYPALLMCCC